MEQFVKPQVVIKEIERLSLPLKRANYTAQEIELATICARHVGPTTASRKPIGDRKLYIPEPTLRDWLKHWKQHGDYYKPKKRGRAEILTAAEFAEVNQSLDGIRDAPNCKSLRARTVHNLTVGILEKPVYQSSEITEAP